MNKPKFSINPSDDGLFYVNLVAPNGEVLNTSEILNSKQGCMTNIEAVKKYAAEAEIIDETN
jgi:uncharacterized protein YegP (UPF0339 family)